MAKGAKNTRNQAALLARIADALERLAPPPLGAALPARATPLSGSRRMAG